MMIETPHGYAVIVKRGNVRPNTDQGAFVTALDMLIETYIETPSELAPFERVNNQRGYDLFLKQIRDDLSIQPEMVACDSLEHRASGHRVQLRLPDDDLAWPVILRRFGLVPTLGPDDKLHVERRLSTLLDQFVVTASFMPNHWSIKKDEPHE